MGRTAYGMVLAMVVGVGCGGSSGGDPVAPETPAGPKEASVAKEDKDALRKELMGIWSKVRTAFAEYRLDEAVPYLDVPAGESRPTREDARALADFLPDIDKARFLAIQREGDIAALYAETSRDPGETEVTVFRFQRAGDRWKIYPSPHSCSSHSVEKTNEEGIRRLMTERQSLRPVPPAE